MWLTLLCWLLVSFLQCTNLHIPHCIGLQILHCSVNFGCFVLGVDKLLSQCAAGFEMNRDAVFVEQPRKILNRHSHNEWNDNFILLLLSVFFSVSCESVPTGTFCGFNKIPLKSHRF